MFTASTQSSQGKGIGKDNFLTIADGTSVVVLFRKPVVEFWSHWNGKFSEVCTRRDPGGCTHCTAGEKASKKIRVNCILSENGKLVAKVWEFGNSVNDMLAMLSTDYNLERQRVKVTRKGKSTDTAYLVTPSAGGEIGEEEFKAIEGIALHDVSVKKATE